MARKRATYDDLKALPEHLVGEIVDGELIATPRPASPHALAASVMGGQLFGFQQGGGGPGGWWILFEPELHLHGDVLVPDLAGWRVERMPRVPDVPAFELPPDWLCELLSPSTARLDRARKLPIYARERVQNVWFVDPRARTLEVLRLESDGWKLAAVHGTEDEPVRVAPFDALALDLRRWWLPEDQTT